MPRGAVAVLYKICIKTGTGKQGLDWNVTYEEKKVKFHAWPCIDRFQSDLSKIFDHSDQILLRAGQCVLGNGVQQGMYILDGRFRWPLWWTDMGLATKVT